MSAERPSGSFPPGRGDRLHPVDWTRQSGAVEDVLQAMQAGLRRRRARRRRIGAASAVVLVALCMLAAWRHPWRAPKAEALPHQAIVVIRPERELLPDGTVVELRPGAQIAVEFTPTLRRVVLASGEAHFHVAKNPEKPFVVLVGAVEVRAVGTAFSVANSDDSIKVLVTEGRVALAAPMSAPPAADPGPVTYLDAGQTTLLERSAQAMPLPAQVTSIPPAQIVHQLAWRVPRLELSGSELVAVLALMNQHSPVRVTFADPSLGQLRVSGILRADNTENLWRLLEEQHGIQVDHDAANGVVLRRKK